MTQISNHIYCADFLTSFDIETKLLPNPYYDYPFLIIENFLSIDECNEINKKVKEDDDFQKAQIKTLDSVVLSETNEEIRKTNIYSLDEKYLELYTNRFLQHQAQIEDYFKIALTTSTSVQVLEYLKNSFYSMHSDDSSMLYKDDELVGFLPVARQRRVSSVLFTTSNDEIPSENTFNGGELLFNFLFDARGNEIKIKPKAGDMLVFLSNPYFTHEVLKVTEGRRITLVQWHNAIIN
ncbi:2OG-Fe(II) oxygenase [Arcobacter sp. s6]|uniref:2OG-Fe(II) oxygenase n=1 Tax=Arcobacter sp. s6 TaxID=3230363 RepID=UPI0034A0645C